MKILLSVNQNVLLTLQLKYESLCLTCPSLFSQCCSLWLLGIKQSVGLQFSPANVSVFVLFLFLNLWPQGAVMSQLQLDAQYLTLSVTFRDWQSDFHTHQVCRNEAGSQGLSFSLALSLFILYDKSWHFSCEQTSATRWMPSMGDSLKMILHLPPSMTVGFSSVAVHNN